ncbi:ribbon-helix-helix protein, CopG family [Arthrobacter tecti]
MERKVDGKDVSEDQVDAWVAEAERGYDSKLLHARLGRPTRADTPANVVPVRLTEAELDAVMARAEREHLSRSEAIRRALAEWSAA